MLKDEIEKGIREGYLKDYICNGSAKSCNDQSKAWPPCEIRTIFGGSHFTREMRGAQNRYFREAREEPLMKADSSNERPAQFRGEVDDVTFNDKDAHHIRHPHCDALVIKAIIANNNVH